MPRKRRDERAYAFTRLEEKAMTDVAVNRGERIILDGNEPTPDTYVLEEPLDPNDLNKAVLQVLLEGTPLMKAERVNTGNQAETSDAGH